MVWSDTTVHSEEPFDRVWPRLSTAHDDTVRIQVDQQAVNSGLRTPAIATRSPALVKGGSLTFAIRRIQGRWQLGAVEHGPAGEQLATWIVEQIHAWGRNRTADPRLTAYPTGTPAPSDVEGKLIVKPNIRLRVWFR